MQEVCLPDWQAAGVRLLVKRDDLIHPLVSGNKWRKLKYNISEAQTQQQDTLLTFGGAYSNHLLATAAAGAAYGFKTIGIIRGGPFDNPSKVLQKLMELDMQLHYVSRSAYRLKKEPDFIAKLTNRFGRFYLLPEGGSNDLAVKGCTEILDNLPLVPDFVACACGTGATIAGLSVSASKNTTVVAVPVLKGASFLEQDIGELLTSYASLKEAMLPPYQPIQFEYQYHGGGYAKAPAYLLDFIKDFMAQTGIPIEPVYTGKLFYALHDLLRKGFFLEGSTVLAIHTGPTIGLV